MAASKTLRVKLVKSKFGRAPGHAECVRGLGLRKIGQSVTVNDDPCIRGMINKVIYLLEVEEAS